MVFIAQAALLRSHSRDQGEEGAHLRRSESVCAIANAQVGLGLLQTNAESDGVDRDLWRAHCDHVGDRRVER